MQVRSLLFLFLLSSVTPGFAQTLQSVTDSGYTTSNPVVLTGHGPRLILKDDQWRFIEWRSVAGAEDAFVGFGASSTWDFHLYNRKGKLEMKGSLLDVKNRSIFNNAADDGSSALRVNGNVRLGAQGQNYILSSYGNLGETISGAATVLGNNAIVNNAVNERIDYSNTTLDGSNAIVMSYYHGTMFHVKASGTQRNAGQHWFSVGDGTDEVMRLTPRRNVLIGTTSDDQTHILQVNGSVKTKRLKVTLTGWADFVFAPDYQLPSLQELEAYVRRHQRLPDIPSEKEVVEQGIDVGEMNRKLLQKVEELTLYIIAQDKELKEVKQRLGALEKTPQR